MEKTFKVYCVEFNTGEVISCLKGNDLKRILRKSNFRSPCNGKIIRFFKYYSNDTNYWRPIQKGSMENGK